MINNYQEDKHSYKGKILEGIILGKIGKVFIAIWICISVVLIVDLFNKREHCVAEALIFMVYVVVFLRANVLAHRMSAKYSFEKTIYTISMTENSINQEVRNEKNEVISSKTFEKKDYKYTRRGIKYLFVFFSNNEVCILKKNGFKEGTEAEFLTELNNNYTRETETRDNTFKSLKTCLIIGIVLGILISVMLIKFGGIDASPLLICVKMIFASTVFTLWLKCAIGSYIKWFNRQKIIMRVLSIVFYPISFGAFMFWGFIELILSVLRTIA